MNTKYMVKFLTTVTLYKYPLNSLMANSDFQDSIAMAEMFLYQTGFKVYDYPRYKEAISELVEGQVVKNWFIAHHIDNSVYRIKMDYSRLWGMM